ncbi:MAG: 6-carboxytetrahydropterin synthase [Bacteroidales bacterium]|nr:6-carboxytetrahydropterin synthase [Bacteroidales bacterium]
MAIVRVTKEFGFEMAHALVNYDGPCKNIHGHSYKLFITVTGVPINDINNTKFGMLIDFNDLKKIVNKLIVNKFDHSVIINKNSSILQNSGIKQMFGKVEFVDYQPTCENMVIEIATKLIGNLPDNVKLHSIKLYETATSYAEWYASDN